MAALPDWRLVIALLASCSALVIVRRILWPVGFMLGFAWTSYAAGLALDARLPVEFDRQDVRLTGWVDDFPQVQAEHVRFSLKVVSADTPELNGRRVRVNWYDPEYLLRPGQHVETTARLRTPHGFVNPAGFDYERWLLLEQISATGYVRTIDPYEKMQRGLAPDLLALRTHIRQQISVHLHSTSAASLTTALAIGDRSGFDDDDWSVFRRAGTSHLVAISGLHVGIVAMVVLWFSRRIMRLAGSQVFDRGRAVAALLALAAASFYAALAGFAVSTLRAVFMLAAALLIAGMLRRVSRAHGLTLAAVLVTAIDPLATLGGSFWLSFGAVATLLIVTAPRSVLPRSAVIGWSLDAGRVQIAVAIAAIPASAIVFGEFSLIALPVNLIAIPWFSIVLVPLVLFCVLLELLVSTPQWMWDMLEWLAGNTMSALESASAFSYASIAVPAPGLLVSLIAVCGVLLVMPIAPLRQRLVGMTALAPLIWPRPDLLPANAFRAMVLDVGHGLSAIVETRSFLLIYDAGARFASGFDIGSDVLLPVLGGRRIPDAMIISHADNDHSGGAQAVVDAFPDIDVLTGPDFDLASGAQCTSGQSWIRDGVSFELLHPADEFVARGNDSSCVLRVTGPGGSLLLAGDIERSGEAALIAAGNIDVDVVVAPHHGSETSSSAAFVAATQPSVVIVSAGYGNRWNFPRESVVERWCAGGADIYVTGEHGAVEVVFDAATPRVRAMRRAAPRYWRTDAKSRCGETTGVTL